MRPLNADARGGYQPFTSFICSPTNCWRYSFGDILKKTLCKTFSWIEADEMKFVDVSICLEFVSSFYQLYFAATFPPTVPQGFISLYIFLHTHLCIILYISFCIFVHILFVFLHISFCIFVHILFVFLYISFCIFVHILFVLWGNFPLNCSPRLCKSVHISAPASESDTRCKFYSSSPFVKDRNTSWSNFSINFIKYISRWYGSTFILGSCHCLYCFLEWRSVLDFRDFLEFWISVVNFMVKICGFMPSGNVVNLCFSAPTAHQDGYM